MIGRLRGRSVRELRDRFVQFSWNEADRLGLVSAPPVAAVTAPAPATPWPAPDAAAISARLSPASRAALIARAETIVAGRFDVLGLRGLSYGTPVDWQLDPLSGRSAPLVHFTRVPYLDHTRVGDHKLTWEVNRHQWFPQLAQAWLLTGDARYAHTAARLLDAWLDANPPKLGINWCSALELAFRMQSWIHGLRLFGTAEAITPALRARLLQSTAAQALHVERNLSTWFSPNTHLTGEALALLSVGLAWPDLPGAMRWKAIGWRVMVDVLPRQVRADGVYFEHATWYQAYTVEFCALAVTAGRALGTVVPEPLLDATRRAAIALRDVTRPDGTIARLGDDDGGSTFTFRVGPLGDVSDALWRAAAALNDPGLLPAHADGSETLLWLEGVEAYDRLRAEHRPVPSRSVAHRDGGWVVLREGSTAPGSSMTRDHCLILDSAPHGPPFFGHSHAAALGIDLTVHGVPMLVDPGTGAYVGAPRQRYRSTAAHNTVTVDGLDSSEQGSSFKWTQVAPTHPVRFAAGTGAQWVTAFHDGYQRLADPVRHRRSLLRIAAHYWLMFDTLEAAATHGVTLTFQAAAGAEIAPGPAGARVSLGGVELMLATDPALALRVEARAVSPAYALEVPAPALVAQGTIAGRTTFCTVLGAADECGAVEVVQAGAQWEVRHARGTDHVACPRGARVTLGPASFDGDVLAHVTVDGRETVVAAGAGRFTLHDHDVSLGADDIRIAHRGADGSWQLES